MGKGRTVDARGGGVMLSPRSSAEMAAPPSPSRAHRCLPGSRSLPPPAAPQAAHPVGRQVGGPVGRQVGGQVASTPRRFAFRPGSCPSVRLIWEAKRSFRLVQRSRRRAVRSYV